MSESEEYKQEAMYGMFNKQDVVDNVRFQIDPSDTLESIRLRLLGKDFDHNTGEIVQYTEPVMKEDGVNELTLTLATHMNKNIVLSNLKQEQIHTICLETSRVIREFIYWNRYKYEIKKEKWSKIVLEIEHQIECFLSRTLDGAEGKRLSTIQRFVEHYDRKDIDEEKKGIKLFR